LAARRSFRIRPARLARGIVAVHQRVADIGAGFICRDNLLLDRYCASNGLLFAAGGRKRRAARKIADGIRLNNDRLEPAHDPRRGLHRGPRATARGNIIS
jgi:hypothetical protein